MRTVVVYVLHYGVTPDELLAYPGATLAAIYDSLSYYYDHRTDIDAEIAAYHQDRDLPDTVVWLAPPSKQ